MAVPDFEQRGTRRFQVIRRLGAGGMGLVYEVVDREQHTRLALKTLRTLSADALVRFKREFRVLQGLQHPNLVTLGELFEEDGQWFYTMELVHGAHLLEWVRPETRADALLSSPATPRLPDGAEQVGGARLDVQRLRDSLAQLGRALEALHGMNKVHRDIKPSNILVTPEGRLVLVDYGLVTDVVPHPDAERSEADVVGTTAYMAPEQAASRPIGPYSDWYAVGVLLYEALTGRQPFAGAPLEVLMNKQRLEPPAPRTISPDAPEDLDALCVELLRIEPAARPPAAEIMRRLGGKLPADERATTKAAPAPPFVGRSTELQALEDAFAAVQGGSAVTVCVHGESGMGKSALVRRFVDALKSPPRAVVLFGRCYERESVPYKALDGVIDALSRYLRLLPPADAAALLPRRAGLLTQSFPVLGRVEAFASARRPAAEVLDPQEQRGRVFSSLRELFTRLSGRHPLVLVIDDLQWADADSLALLAELLRPPEAPALLLVATVRTVQKEEGATGVTLDVTRNLAGDVRHLSVERLPPAEARELAGLLVQRAKTGRLDAAAIAEEAGGHPLFIDELIRHGADRAAGATPVSPSDDPTAVRLDDALWSRILKLDVEPRQLLELIAVAGAPLRPEVAVAAAGVDPTEFGRWRSLLQTANLVRTTRSRAHEAIEPYHDRVREAVSAHLDPDRRRRCHQQLAVALAAASADPETLCVHWHGAGDFARASEHATKAAEQAAAALAFDRAVRLYRLAIELKAPSGPYGQHLRTRLGDALSNAGRGGEAAEAYLAAAKSANPAEALDLQRRAADQLLRSGHVDDGLTAIRAVLRAVGLELASSPRRALISLLIRRAHIRLRGLGYRERALADVPPELLTRIDVCWSVASGLGLVDTIRAADFQTRHLVLALEAGEPYRVTRALSTEAGHAATTGGPGRKRAAKLVALAQSLAEKHNDPHALGMAWLATGTTAFLVGEWARTAEFCDRAEALFRERCAGVQWEVASAQLFSVWAAAQRGELADLQRRVPRLLQEHEERGDLYGATSQRTGLANLVWLAAGDVYLARQHMRDAMRQWSQTGFHFQHYWNLLAQGHIDLYVGEAAASHKRIAERWKALAGSMYLRVQNVRVEALHLRARVALAIGKIPEAERDARKILREKMPWSDAQAQLLLAGIAAARGDLASALPLLDQAAAGFDATGMAAYAAAARRRRGESTGGTEGQLLITTADACLASQKIVNPKRWCALLAPGFPD